MRILVCASAFKGSISPNAAAGCIEDGILRGIPTATIRKVPMADGGEGFARALITATGGRICPVQVLGPIGSPIQSYYGLLGRPGPKTAVIEIAAAAGLSLVPSDCRNPCITTGFGVGQLIAAALDDGVERIVVGRGDSGVSDGGVELPVASGGQYFLSLPTIGASDLHPALKSVDIEVACNWKNVLCGPYGVARMYGPQEGATPEQTELLAASSYASITKQCLGVEIPNALESGASGGLGAAFILVGGTLRPRYEAVVSEYGAISPPGFNTLPLAA